MTQQIIQQQRSEPFSQRLSRWSHEFDLITNHLLGYIIAFTSLVAFADVLGGGQVLAHVPFLYWLWVLAQGLGVEYQVLVLIKRLPGYWQTNKTMFVVYSVFILFLCIMSVVIGSVFTEHDQQHSSIEVAMNTLGISHIGFVYARSALAILLVALIAIDRAIEQQRDVVSGQILPPVEQRVVIDRLETLAGQQAELAAATAQVLSLMPSLVQGVHSVQQRVQEGEQSLSTSVQMCLQGMQETLHTLITHVQSVQASESAQMKEVVTTVQGGQETMRKLLATVQGGQETLSELGETVQQLHQALHHGQESEQGDDVHGEELSIEQKIRAVLETHPDASSRVVASAIGCSPTTANKWLTRIRSGEMTPPRILRMA